MLITFRFHLSISCSCNFHDTISQQLHCRFRPYVSRKAATPSQSASHNPLIPIREMLGANKTTCPLPQCGTSKCHQTPIYIQIKPFAGAGRKNSASSMFPNTSLLYLGKILAAILRNIQFFFKSRFETGKHDESIS